MIKFEFIDAVDQEFSTTIQNQRITMRLLYSSYNDRWSFDLSIDGEPVLTGRKIVEGVDLLESFNFGLGVMFAFSDPKIEPNRDAIPAGTVSLYHISKEEFIASMAS